MQHKLSEEDTAGSEELSSDEDIPRHHRQHSRVPPIPSSRLYLSSALKQRASNPKEEDDENWNNGWTPQVEATIRKWQKDIEKSSFIYSELLANNNNRMQQALVATLLLSALITLLSALSVALGALTTTVAVNATTTSTSEHITWTLFTFSIVQTLAGIGIVVWNGLLKVYGWDVAVQNLTRFVERLDSQWFVFETELSIPAAQRLNGDDFIKRADGDYMHLMQQCPPIMGDDYVAANQKYQERLFNNFVWQQKFKLRIEDAHAQHPHQPHQEHHQPHPNQPEDLV